MEEKVLDVAKIVADLKSKRDQIDRAIEALEGSGPRHRAVKMSASASSTMLSATPGRKRGRLTAAGRKRLSEAMKRRWAERRKKG